MSDMKQVQENVYVVADTLPQADIASLWTSPSYQVVFAAIATAQYKTLN